MVKKKYKNKLIKKSEHILLKQRERSVRGIENAFCYVHNLLFACLTDNIQKIVF